MNDKETFDELGEEKKKLKLEWTGEEYEFRSQKGNGQGTNK